MAPVRAVNLSIGPFCTEFRRESFCDDDAFWDRGQLLELATITLTKFDQCGLEGVLMADWWGVWAWLWLFGWLFEQ